MSFNLIILRVARANFTYVKSTPIRFASSPPFAIAQGVALTSSNNIRLLHELDNSN